MQIFGVRDLRNNIGKYTAEAESGAISVIAKNGNPLTINIPFDKTLIELGAHKSLAVKLYSEEVLSLNRAAKLADLKMDEFIKLLGSQGVSVFGYEPEELDEELE